MTKQFCDICKKEFNDGKYSFIVPKKFHVINRLVGSWDLCSACDKKLHKKLKNLEKEFYNDYIHILEEEGLYK